MTTDYRKLSSEYLACAKLDGVKIIKLIIGQHLTEAEQRLHEHIKAQLDEYVRDRDKFYRNPAVN